MTEFTDSFHAITKAPLFGYGLGIGTNAGAKFLTGRSMFLLSESEWPRIFLECGSILGLIYVVWRCGLAISIGLLCVRSVREGHVLPLLIFSAGALALTSGQFGQPTVLGFAVFVNGLALAARNRDEQGAFGSGWTTHAALPPAPRPIPRRSAYAERLHGAAASGKHHNGSADR
jgi:hypothetical protein